MGAPVSSTNKTDRHDITEMLLKMALSTINQTNQSKDSTNEKEGLLLVRKLRHSENIVVHVLSQDVDLQRHTWWSFLWSIS
jgi:hypothetical protein